MVASIVIGAKPDAAFGHSRTGFAASAGVATARVSRMGSASALA
jgi:hypothetical protein